MKIYRFLIILLIIVGCENQSTNPDDLVFSIDQLDNLELENMDSLWKGEEIYKNNIDRFLDNNEGFKGGLELGSDNTLIFIYVFESKETALQLAEEYLTTISMYTEESDDHTIIKERWWHTPYSNNTIFVNKLNTLLRLTHRLEADSNFTQNVALEIMDIIEQRSE